MQLPQIQAWGAEDGENLNTYIISYRHWRSTDRHWGGLGRQEHMRQYPVFVHNLLDHVSGCHLHGHWKRWPIIGHHSYRCWSCKNEQVVVKIYRMKINGIQVCAMWYFFLLPLHPHPLKKTWVLVYYRYINLYKKISFLYHLLSGIMHWRDTCMFAIHQYCALLIKIPKALGNFDLDHAGKQRIACQWMMRNLCYTQWPSLLSDQLYKSTPIRLQPASKMQNEQLIGLISLWGVQGFNTIKTWLESQDSKVCNYLSQALHLIRDLLTKKSMVAIYRQSTYKIQGGLNGPIKSALTKNAQEMYRWRSSEFTINWLPRGCAIWESGNSCLDAIKKRNRSLTQYLFTSRLH